MAPLSMKLSIKLDSGEKVAAAVVGSVAERRNSLLRNSSMLRKRFGKLIFTLLTSVPSEVQLAILNLTLSTPASPPDGRGVKFQNRLDLKTVSHIQRRNPTTRWKMSSITLFGRNFLESSGV